MSASDVTRNAAVKVGAGKIRVGLIGVGNWATYGHLPALALLPDYEVVAVYARRREAAEAAAKRFHIKHVVDTVDELVRHPEVDLVLVLSTAPQHEEHARAAIAAGKHVYSEWPLTTSTARSVALVELADQAGLRHIVGLQRRLAPVYRYAHDLIAQGYIGELRSVRLHVSMNYFQALRSQALQWTVPPENFSSVIAIYAGHYLDALFAATGKLNSLAGVLVNQFKEVTIAETGEVIPTTTPDQLVLAGTFANDAVLSVHVEGGKRNNSGVQIDITGDAGDLKITNKSAFGDPKHDYVLEGAHGDDLPLEVLTIPAAYNWLPACDLPSSVLELANLYAAFARDLREGSRTAPSFEDGVWMHRLLDAAATSSDGGKRVDLS